MTRPLDGITVVSLEHAIAAPFCTRQLADLGARVIKVERPGDYALDGVPLLHALLTPAGKRGKHVYWDMPAQEAARLRQAYRDALPARTRMLQALLATRPALDDITYESRRPSLQLALLYGSP